jgi:hypothetical protein
MISDNDFELSPTSGSQMKNIGFVEKSDTDKDKMIKFLVDSAKGISAIKMQKEVSPMTEETTNVVDNVEVVPEATETVVTKSVDAEVAETVAVETNEAVVETEIVKSEEVVETVEKTEEIAKSDDTAVEAIAEIKNTLANAFGDLTAMVKSLNEETVLSLQAQIADLSKSIQNISGEVKEVKDSYNEFGKRVDAVEQDTAFRKSGDLGEIVQEPEMVQKSIWGGRFLTDSDLFK